MPESWTINSYHSLTAFNQHNKKLFEEHKYITYSEPRYGADRSIDQNSLFHVWVREYIAHLLNISKKDVCKGLMAGTKKTLKAEYYLELHYPWMIHAVRSAITGESKMDYTSSDSYKQGDMFEFMCWIQGKAANDGLVLESKGEFNKIRRERVG